MRYRKVNRLALTLIELFVVLLLVGFMTGLAVIATAPQIRSARLNDLIRELQQADAAERREARKNPQAGGMLVSFEDNQIRYRLSHRMVRIPSGYEVASIQHPLNSASGPTLARLSRGRDALVTGFNSLGQSITYSVRLRHISSDTSREVGFIGLSGQPVLEPLSSAIVAFEVRQ